MLHARRSLLGMRGRGKAIGFVRSPTEQSMCPSSATTSIRAKGAAACGSA